MALFAAPSVAAEPALAEVEERGAALYAYDQAAWVATDDLLAKAPQIRSKPTMRGWVVEQKEERLKVTFYAGDGAVNHAAYIVHVRGSQVLDSHPVESVDEKALSALAIRMIAAKDIAKSETREACVNAPFNSVVLPPRSPDEIYFSPLRRRTASIRPAVTTA